LTLASLFDRCEQSGVSLRLNDDGTGIKYDAPGGINPNLKAELSAHKHDLVHHLTSLVLERCAAWLTQQIRGRYPRLADVKAAAAAAGFSPVIVIAALGGPKFVTYRSFPRRHVGEVERVRTVDDWPDDPPRAGR